VSESDLAPSWQPDPFKRHHYRWWDGAEWTESVADKGRVSIDPLPSAPAPPRVTVSTMPALDGDPPSQASPTPGAGYATEPIPGSPVRRWFLIGLTATLVLGVLGYLWFTREQVRSQPSALGVTLGQLTGPGQFVSREVRMDDGDAIRFRVEGNEDRDLLTYFVAEDQLATDHVLRYFTDYGTNVGLSDSFDLLTDLTEADDVLSDSEIQDRVRNLTIIQASDRCCAGVPDTDEFIATVPGTYRIVVVEAEGRDSDVRIVVEKLSRQLFSYAEITDALENDPFFTDTGFFEDTEPYVLNES
jgi:hypothetical protein